MFRLAFRTLRYRAASFGGVFAAIFAGAAIIMACGGLMETGIRLNAPPERLRTPIVISSQHETSEQARLSDAVKQKAAKVKGVETVIADYSFAVELTSLPATGTGLYGHSWSSAELTPYKIIDGSASVNSKQVILDSATALAANVTPGKELELTIKGQRRQFVVSGIVEAQSVYKKPAFFFAEDFTTALLQGQQPDALGIIASSSANLEDLRHELEVALTSEKVSVLAGDDRGIAEYPGMSGAREVLIAGSAPFGGNTIVVVGLVVAGILGLTIRQRTREMALLQTIGATPGQVRRMVVSEVMVIAVLATGLAIVPGYWLGEAMFYGLQANGMVPSQVLFYQGFIPRLVGVAVGIVASLVASLSAARHATNVQPLEALAELTTQQRWFNWGKLVVALVGLSGGIALAVVTALVMRGAIASSTAGPAVLPWLLAFTLMAPALIIPALALLSRPLKHFFAQAVGYLAFKNVRIRHLQSAAIISPIVLAAAMALSMMYQQTTLTAMTEKSYTDHIDADIVVQAEGNGMSLDAARAVASVPGVAASSPVVISEGRFLQSDGIPSEEPLRLQGIAAMGAQDIFRYEITEGNISKLNGKSIALPVQTAAGLNRKLGDEITMRMADGRDETFKITSLFKAPAGFESALVPVDVMAQHTASGLVKRIAVQTDDAYDAAEFQSRVAKNTQNAIQIAHSDAFLQDIRSQTSVLAWVNNLFTIMVTLYALLFLINTVVISITARRREFGLQQLIGSTKQEVLRMIIIESISLAIIGVVFGAVVSSVSLVSFSIAINGTPFPQGSWLIMLYVIIGAVTLSVLVAATTAWAALRAKPIEAAASRE